MIAPALWRRLRHDRRGVAALETGLVVGCLLLPLLTIVAGAGQALLTQVRLDRAVHAAAMYGWAVPTAVTADLTQAAGDGFSAAGKPVTTSAALSCYCVTPSTGVRDGTTVSCTASCGSGKVRGNYITVTASASFTPLLTMTWGTAPWALSSTATVRVR